MGSIVASLVTVSESMRTVQKAIDVSGNNVANAQTPGFAKQDLSLVAKLFDIDKGLPGGVSAGDLLSSRSKFLEASVREQNQRVGRLSQQTSLLGQIEPLFDISKGGGISGAVDGLFQAFSQWSINPNDGPVRGRVIDRAKDLAAQFHYTSESLAKAASTAKVELGTVVEKVNRLAELVARYNVNARSDFRARQDPGLEAHINQTLEDLSELVDYDIVEAKDGALTVSIGGQTPIVIGDHVYPLKVDTGGAAVAIRDANGNDITGQIEQGRLRAVVDFSNTVVPGIQADLDTLAKSIADNVNTTLANGLDRNNQTPPTGLFTYGTPHAAATLAVTNLKPGELAGALTSSPGGNGNALNLAALGTTRLLGDFTFTQYFGEIAGGVGRTLGTAREDEQTQGLLLSQARNLRAGATEVDLNEEAAKVVSFQRQYEANAELFRVLNELSETLINIIR